MSPRTRGTESSQAHRDGKRGGGVGLAEGLGAPGADGDRVSGSRERRVWGRLAVTTGPQCEGPEHLPAAHLETVRMAYLCHVHFYRNKKKKNGKNLTGLPLVTQGGVVAPWNSLECAVLLISFYFSQTANQGCFRGGGQGGEVKSCFLGNLCPEPKNVSVELICYKCNFATFFEGRSSQCS